MVLSAFVAPTCQVKTSHFVGEALETVRESDGTSAAVFASQAKYCSPFEIVECDRGSFFQGCKLYSHSSWLGVEVG